ncbi:hypothetical protein EJ03DRAFT_186227 [Teratosphaeria nubilosa]|uniref:Uncharacterized protein n=1 Tax=Teratosphaeria nubilosa TaxID=161662 RepID=A0A6G1LI19_9PEZI|nr:hypothetical protein EJ03DRAFT_186227 [Teratosphaeria nubilosa]
MSVMLDISSIFAAATWLFGESSSPQRLYIVGTIPMACACKGLSYHMHHASQLQQRGQPLRGRELKVPASGGFKVVVHIITRSRCCCVPAGLLRCRRDVSGHPSSCNSCQVTRVAPRAIWLKEAGLCWCDGQKQLCQSVTSQRLGGRLVWVRDS